MTVRRDVGPSLFHVLQEISTKRWDRQRARNATKVRIHGLVADVLHISSSSLLHTPLTTLRVDHGSMMSMMADHNLQMCKGQTAERQQRRRRRRE